jgi:CubicO group peptidase (beta-lactamase class C family)
VPARGTGGPRPRPSRRTRPQNQPWARFRGSVSGKARITAPGDRGRAGRGAGAGRVGLWEWRLGHRGERVESGHHARRRSRVPVAPSITAVMRDLAIPGAVVLVRTTQQRREAFGTRVVGTDNPVQVRDHFRVGSNPKTMTGTVVLQLVQEGRMALSDPISSPAQRPRSAAPKPWRRGRCPCRQVSVRRTALVNGIVAVVVASRGQLLLALTFTIEDDGIAEYDVIAEPARLQKLDSLS